MDGANPPPRSLHSTSRNVSLVRDLDISWEVPPPKFPPRKKKKLARKRAFLMDHGGPSNGLNSLGEGE